MAIITLHVVVLFSILQSTLAAPVFHPRDTAGPTTYDFITEDSSPTTTADSFDPAQIYHGRSAKPPARITAVDFLQPHDGRHPSSLKSRHIAAVDTEVSERPDSDVSSIAGSLASQSNSHGSPKGNWRRGAEGLATETGDNDTPRGGWKRDATPLTGGTKDAVIDIPKGGWKRRAALPSSEKDTVDGPHGTWKRGATLPTKGADTVDGPTGTWKRNSNPPTKGADIVDGPHGTWKRMAKSSSLGIVLDSIKSLGERDVSGLGNPGDIIWLGEGEVKSRRSASTSYDAGRIRLWTGKRVGEGIE